MEGRGIGDDAILGHIPEKSVGLLPGSSDGTGVEGTTIEEAAGTYIYLRRREEGGGGMGEDYW